MKQTLLAALLAAVASSALTLLLSAGPGPAPAGTTAAEFRVALADLVAEVSALRRELAAGGNGVPTGAPLPDPPTSPSGPERLPPVGEAPGAGDPAPAAVPAAEDVPVVEEFAPPRERSAIPRAPDLVDRLRGLTKWEESADVRARWILVPEESVVAAFGKPDEIYVQEGGAESWIFRTLTGTADEEGVPEWKDISLEFNRGRLVRVYD